MQMQKQKSGGTRKHGRASRSSKKQRYETGQRRLLNKLKRILKSNGEYAVKLYKRGIRVFPKRGKS